MLRYRIARLLHEGCVFGMFWVYIGAFVLAFLGMFVLPPLSLGILFAALLSLPFVVIACIALRGIRGLVARVALDGGRCPACGRAMSTHRDRAESWSCPFCEVCFLPGGLEQDRALIQTE